MGETINVKVTPWGKWENKVHADGTAPLPDLDHRSERTKFD